MSDAIVDFSGKYAFLSNFAPSPFEWFSTRFGAVHALTVEHAYQAEKALFSDDFHEIAGQLSPGSAKRLGRQCRMRPDWEDVKLQIMERALAYKFSSRYGLARSLVDTGDAELIEGNHWHDNIWGQCFCRSCGERTGLNLLGKSLMKLRDTYAA